MGTIIPHLILVGDYLPLKFEFDTVLNSEINRLFLMCLILYTWDSGPGFPLT